MSEKKYYIYSTLTDAVDYQVVQQGGGDLPVVQQNIVIQGGANIPDKFLRTPQGVVTPVTEQELEALRQNQVFLLHERNGFIKVGDKKADPEKVAADMTTRDNSAPLVDADFKEDQQPKIAGKTEEEPAAPKGNNRRA